MTLSPTEYLDHLREVASTAGVAVPEIVLPDEHHVILRRMRFRSLDWGAQDKPVVLFLHGGSLTAHTWDLPCLLLRHDYHCLALDLRGHGDSGWSPEMDYGLEAHAGDVAAFVDLLGLDRLAVVGMSLGGLAAIAYAGRRTGRLGALVVVDVGPRMRIEGPRRMSTTRLSARSRSRDPRLLRKSLPHNLRRRPDGQLTWKHDRRHRGTIDLDDWARRRRALWTEVPRITCPTLVVRGARRDVFHDEDAAKLAEALPRGEWVWVEDAGHTVQAAGDMRRGVRPPRSGKEAAAPRLQCCSAQRPERRAGPRQRAMKSRT